MVDKVNILFGVSERLCSLSEKRSQITPRRVPTFPQHLVLPELETAFEYISICLALPFVVPSTRNKFALENVAEQLSKIAHYYRYEGRWKIVGELSQLPLDTLGPIVDKLLEHYSPHDLFGNIVPCSLRLARGLKYKDAYSSAVTDPRPVKRMPRKRGYDDKGHLRPNHKKRQVSLLPKEHLPRKSIYKPRSHEFMDLKIQRKLR
jgi:hypothetical protein